MNYLIHILIVILIYVTLASSLNLLAGFGGLLSICHAAFYGLGAYSVAILCNDYGWTWIEAFVFGIGLAAATAACVGYVSLRFRDDYFVIATFAFQMLIFSLMQNWRSLTYGPMGISGIKHPTLAGFPIDSTQRYLLILFLYVGVTTWFSFRISRSPFGRILKAIREDDTFVESLAKNARSVKLSVFVLAACLAAGVGGIFGSYISYVDPNSFTVMESILILAIVIIGGAGSVWGALLGSVVIIGLPEALRFVGMPSSIAANFRQILFGAALVACMLWRPQGFLGEFKFRSSAKP